MPYLRKDGENCYACYLRGCDCECKTCVGARKRNMELTSRQLDAMNARDAGMPEEQIEQLYGKDTKPST